MAAAPLLASADTAALKEYANFGPKIPHLPKQTRDVLADSGYDTNAYGQRIEYDDHDRRSGRHFLCPPNIRNAARCKTPPADPKLHVPWKRRQLRIAHYRSRRGRALFRRRCQSVEPFNEWFKKLFELDQRVWHRGLDNNRTQLLAAIFSYQLLLRYNHRRGRHNGQIMWIIDARKESYSGKPRSGCPKSIITIGAERREPRRWISSPWAYSRVPE